MAQRKNPLIGKSPCSLSFLLSIRIRDCANDLIRDISDVIFEELVKYKLYENANQTAQINVDEQISSMDDGDNDNKYQIELAESENRPLNLYVERERFLLS